MLSYRFRWNHCLLTAVIMALVVGWPRASHATPPAPEALISNPTLSPSGEAPHFILHWLFESVSLVYGAEMGTVHQEVRTFGDAYHRVPANGRGVLIAGETPLARGDLVSAPFSAEPFRWIEVTVEYIIESGEPLALVGLRPTDDRSRIDLAFLPAGERGQIQRETVRLHTGRHDGDYSIALSLVGAGAVRYLSVEASFGESYAAPEQPVVVIDLMRPDPLESGPYGWDAIQKLVDVFGFSEIRFIHPLEVTPELLDSISPAMIVLSPTSEEMLRVDPVTLDLQKYLGGVRLAAEYGKPVVGVCAGHHVLAMAHDGRVGVVAERGPDGIRELVEWGPTELTVTGNDVIFDGLPRGRIFRAVEAHSAVVHSSFTMPENLATSEICKTQIFRYPDKPWYTFQCHIEADWEYACPETQLIWKNLCRKLGLTDAGNSMGG